MDRTASAFGSVSLGQHAVLAAEILAGRRVSIRRRVSATGVVMVAWQKISLGRVHAGKTVTINVGDSELTVECDNGIRTIRRSNTNPVTRIKAHRPRKPNSQPTRNGDRMNGDYATGRFAHVGNLDQVESHTDAAQIVEQMLVDLRGHPDEWENSTLERFLDALATSLGALPDVYTNRSEPFPTQPTWKILAEALVMASGYE